MALFPTITKKRIAAPFTGGFSYTEQWVWEDGSIPQELLPSEIQELYQLLDVSALYDTFITVFPEVITEGTILEDADGDEWEVPSDAYIHEYRAPHVVAFDFDTEHKNLLNLPSTATYYYVEEPFIEEEVEEPEFWAYPSGLPDTHYLVHDNWGGTPDFQAPYWVTVASEQTYFTTVLAGFHRFFGIENSDAYDLVSWSTYICTVSDLAGFLAIEGKYPIDLFNDDLQSCGFTTRKYWTGTGWTLEIWHYPNGFGSEFGFTKIVEEAPEPVEAIDGMSVNLLTTGFLLGNLLFALPESPLFRPFQLYAEPRKMAMGGSPSKPLGGSTSKPIGGRL